MSQCADRRSKTKLIIGFHAVLALFVVVSTFTLVAAINPVVRIESGLVRGSGTDVVAFKGIPFAAPPVGPLRWKAPQPAAPWEGTRDAVEFCPSCPQPVIFAGAVSKQSEDCLGLNIWTPAKSAGDKLPVMAWIYGGGFTIGSSSQPTYDGEALARQGVIVVSFNYRLGALGFLAHPDLSRETPEGVSGNYGLLDQIAALKWVQRNIRNFGGDPGQVTIFGESAGGASVMTLLVSPLAKGLFHRAIAQSGTYAFTPIRHLRESWYGYKSAEAAGAEIGDLKTLREMSVQDLLKKALSSGHPFFDFGRGIHRPIVDGWVLPDEPSTLYEQGRINQVPLIAGVNADEATLLLMQLRTARTVAAYRTWLEESFGEEAAGRIIKMYPAAVDSDVNEAIQRLVTDFMFVEPTISVLRAVESKAPVYLYRFTRVGAGGKATKLGAFHSSEIVYVFGTYKSPILPLPGADKFDDTDFAVGRAMMASWLQFAKTGDPNGPGLLKWPRYSARDQQCLEFGDAPGPAQVPGVDVIDLLCSEFKGLKAARVTR